MPKKIYFFILFLLVGCSCFSQRKSFEDYYNEAKSFTGDFRSYKVIIVRSDTSFAPRYDIQSKRLRTYFPFLNTMKEVEKNPDCFIKIIIKDSNQLVDYRWVSGTVEENVYELIVSYDLKFLLQFDAGDKGNMTMPLCDFIHYDLFPTNLSGQITLKNYYSGKVLTDDQRKLNDINTWMEAAEHTLKRTAEFSDQFSSTLKKFTRQ
jgi:hypothetical protein